MAKTVDDKLKSGCLGLIMFFIFLLIMMVSFSYLVRYKNIDAGVLVSHEPPVRYVEMDKNIYDRIEVHYRYNEKKKIQIFLEKGYTVLLDKIN